MITDRTTAKIVGVFYIIGTTAGVLSVFVMAPFSNASDLLKFVNVNPHRIELGALLQLVMGFPLAMVAVLMFPILKRQSEVLAIAYVVFRGALEQIFYIATATCWLVVVVAGRQYADSGAGDASQFHVLGTLVYKAVDPILAIGGIIFNLGALILYYLLYQARLIPRWISVFGFICVAGGLVAGLSFMFGTNLDFLKMPMLPQEMIMAVWFIAKGFSPSAIASENGRRPLAG